MFRSDTWLVSPDHMHLVITLPEGDDDFSNGIKAIKIPFATLLHGTAWSLLVGFRPVAFVENLLQRPGTRCWEVGLVDSCVSLCERRGALVGVSN